MAVTWITVVAASGGAAATAVTAVTATLLRPLLRMVTVGYC